MLKDDEIGFLCPSYEGFLSLREEHFLDAQRETDVQADSNCYMYGTFIEAIRIVICDAALGVQFKWRAIRKVLILSSGY